MKRLAAVTLSLAILIASNVAFASPAEAAGGVPAIRSLDVNALIGLTETALEGKYGEPARIEASEYGFSWYVYNRDYQNFFMAGVRDGRVVAAYSNAKALSYKGRFGLNAAKPAVRALLGNPVSYIRSGSTVRVLSNAAERDYFPVQDDYVVVFYDTLKGNAVTSVLIVPKAEENGALLGHPALSTDLLAAYQRISIDLINSVRARNGLKTLSSDWRNTKLALSRSKDMRDRGYFSHYTPAPDSLSPFQQAKTMGIRYRSMGENIAYGDHNAIFAHEAFMDSAGHRSNVLKPSYTKVGVGAAYGGSRYVLLTVEFTN